MLCRVISKVFNIGINLSLLTYHPYFLRQELILTIQNKATIAYISRFSKIIASSVTQSRKVAR